MTLTELGKGIILPAKALILGGAGDAVFGVHVDLNEFDGAGEVACLDVLDCGLASLEGAGAKKDDVGCFFEKQKGKGEADATVGCTQRSVKEERVELTNIPPVMRVIFLSLEIMMLFFENAETFSSLIVSLMWS
jgi:hypothetical protein